MSDPKWKQKFDEFKKSIPQNCPSAEGRTTIAEIDAFGDIRLYVNRLSVPDAVVLRDWLIGVLFDD